MKRKILIRDVVDRCFDRESKMVMRSAIKDYATAEMERKLTITECKAMSDRTAEIYLSTRHVDGVGDIVTPDGWDLTFYNMNPKGLWSHNPQMLPVFKALWTKADEFGLRQKIQFADHEFAQDIWELFKGGYISTFSAGFRVNKTVHKGEQGFDGMVKNFRQNWKEYTDVEHGKTQRLLLDKTLFESSICNLPCNPYAMVVAIGEGKIKVSEYAMTALRVEDYKKKMQDEGTLAAKTVTVSMKADAKPDLENKEQSKKIERDYMKSLPPVDVLKPYPKEHAFRINDPDGYKEFRRENDAFGDGVSAIWGIYEDDGETESEVQTIRFDASKFTMEQARKWMKDHPEHETILEEEATDENNSDDEEERTAEPVQVKKALQIKAVSDVHVSEVVPIETLIKEKIKIVVAKLRGEVK